jgi:hypothetical protein
MNETVPTLLRSTVFLGHFVLRPLPNLKTMGAVSFDLHPPRPRDLYKTAKGGLPLLALACRLPFALCLRHFA